MEKNDRARLARTNNLLKDKLLHWLPEPGRYPTAIEGLLISRRHDAKELENCIIYKPLIAVIVQGSKHSVIGSEVPVWDNLYLVFSVTVWVCQAIRAESRRCLLA